MLQTAVCYRDEGVAIGICGCVVILAWRGDATLERVEACAAIIRARAEACGRAIALLNVIEDGAEPPRGEAARCIDLTLEELHPRVVGAAIVFEEGSSWLAMALDAIAAVGRKTLLQKHTVHREEACVWVQRRCEAAGEPETPTKADLVRAIALVQRAIDEP